MFLIIGNGRVATHFCYYFEQLQLPFQQWARSTHTTQDLSHKITQCTHVLLLISDDAITAFIKAHPGIQTKICVHFSGCLMVADCYGAHPLMTFTPNLYSLAQYRQIPFVIAKAGPAFAEILPGLPNKSFTIDQAQKPLYHALCVMSGNFTVMLWQHCIEQMQAQCQLPQTVLMPYMQRIFTNLLTAPDGALTGPIARGDQQTIQDNLNALSGDSFQQVYAAFVSAYNIHNNLKEQP